MRWSSGWSRMFHCVEFGLACKCEHAIKCVHVFKRISLTFSHFVIRQKPVFESLRFTPIKLNNHPVSRAMWVALLRVERWTQCRMRRKAWIRLLDVPGRRSAWQWWSVRYRKSKAFFFKKDENLFRNLSGYRIELTSNDFAHGSELQIIMKKRGRGEW